MAEKPGFFDFNNDFYRPLSVRVTIVAVCFGWGAFEFSIGSPFWGVIFCAAGGIAVHGLFIAYNPPSRETADKPENEEDPS